MARARIALALCFAACGPRVGGDDPGEGSGGASSSTSTSTTEASSSSETGEPGCEREPALEWSVNGKDLEALAVAATPTPTGEVAVIGSRRLGYGDSDAYLEIRDMFGSVPWSVVYDGANDLWDEGLDVAVDDLGHVYMLVQEQVHFIDHNKIPTSDARLVVLRYDAPSERVFRWEREHPPLEMPGDYSPEGLIEVVDDRVLVLAYVRDEPTLLLELDVAGNVRSELEIPVDDELRVAAREIAENGDVAIVGQFGEFGDRRLRATRFDRTGTQLWTKVFGTNDDYPLAIMPSASGETYVAFVTSVEEDVEATLYLRRFEVDGSEGWTQTLLVSGRSSYDAAGAIAQDGSVLVTARHSALDPLDPSGYLPIWVARYTPDGCRVWLFEHAFPAPVVAGQADAVVDLAGAALVLATYDYNFAWMGLVTE